MNLPKAERLYFREMSLNDLDAICAIVSDPETMRYYPKPLDREEAIEWIERNLGRYRQDGFGLWACIMKSTDELVGQCGLVVQQVDGRREIEIGYLFRREYWNQGLGTEAAQAVKEYAFDQLKLNRVISLVRPINEASKRVAVKNGMKVEKEVEHKGYLHYVYAIEK